MFEAGLLPLWLNVSGVLEPPEPNPSPSLTAVLFIPQEQPRVDRLLDNYLVTLNAKGFPKDNQAIWVQTQTRLLINHAGATPRPPASLTKVATSLAALYTWPDQHRFQSQVWAMGPIEAGVLKGDLLIEGGLDLALMRSEAIALGQTLEKLGIKQISGNLWIDFPVANALPEPEQLGTLLREGMNQALWTDETKVQYSKQSGPAPQISLGGQVKPGRPTGTPTLLFKHDSPPLLAILKYMNVYSDNAIAESLTELMGGTPVLMARVQEQTDLPAAELALSNGSGLGDKNRLSPRAAVGLFQVLQVRLSQNGQSLNAVFPVSGQDLGTLEDRKMPTGTVVKTGTLWNVSGLAGYLPNTPHGPLWFAIMNQGEGDLDGFRQEQDRFLQNLTRQP